MSNTPKTSPEAAVARGANDGQIAQKNTTHMSPKAASRNNFDIKTFPFMKLPQELREEIIRLSLPEEIFIFMTEYTPGTDPSVIPALATLGSQKLRLECILAVSEKAWFQVTSKKESVNLRNWLASIDFAPLQPGTLNPLTDGFSAVRKLCFSDVNCLEMYDYRLLARYYRRTKIEPSTWADDLELIRRCKNLHTLEMDMSLPNKFLNALRSGHSLEQVIRQVGGFGKYQLTKLLKIKGLKVLRLRFWNPFWENPGLYESEEDPIFVWLNKEFRKRGQTVEVLKLQSYRQIW